MGKHRGKAEPGHLSYGQDGKPLGIGPQADPEESKRKAAELEKSYSDSYDRAQKKDK